ncbi:hypothetical protein KDA_02360 [Dictyobacter alpinus]|uniref:non-specific serine/threonine protein kinase n=1 Tax=Dictyobacter alpinus TaxID=2014873 RepID=A0A402B080_9CHLR|nr:FHA domain-containing serine/threonine-protein kinase [Dictyobacter alpinus]GCE24752.1 hypothetical protein KDA_02360 [Dictyobacter alpinus]
MPQRDARLIGGVYRIGQIITGGGLLTTSTAYNHNTNDVVGLYVVDIPSSEQIDAIPALLKPYEKRRLVQSPHVLHVLDWGIDGTRIYIATDPPRGLTLQHVLDTENIDLARAIDLCQHLLLGLRALHAEGIAGLDLRPQLITVDTVGIQDRVQIDDIGLRTLLYALHYVDSQRPDDIGYLDPRYTAPEYIHHTQIGPWSDIYQVGLLLFTLYTGRLPFVGSTPAETGILQTASPLPPIKRFKHKAPDSLQALVEHAMSKDPAQRFSSAEEFLRALDTFQKTLTAGPLKKSKPERENGTSATAAIPQKVLERITGTDARLHDGSKTIRKSQPSTELLNVQVPNEQGIYAYLCHEKKGELTQRIAITQRNLIVGRLDPKRGVSPDLDLSHIDPKMSISRQHARIRFEDTFFSIEDLKSRNKTRLNDRVLTPLKPELLTHGAQIAFGSVNLRFEVPGMKPDAT